MHFNGSIIFTQSHNSLEALIGFSGLALNQTPSSLQKLHSLVIVCQRTSRASFKIVNLDCL